MRAQDLLANGPRSWRLRSYVWPAGSLALPDRLEPIVATDVNVLPEIIINGRNGFIVSSEDAYGLAQVIMRLIKSKALRQRISQQNIRDCQERFDLQVAAQETDSIYRLLLDS